MDTRWVGPGGLASYPGALAPTPGGRAPLVPPVPPAYGWMPPAGLPSRSRTRRLAHAVLLMGGVGVLLVCALVLGLLLLASAGPVGLLVGLVLAVLPMIAVAHAYVWLDRYEPEPPPLLAALFLWGAVVAALAAALVNSTAEQVLAAVQGQAGAMATTAVIVAPIVEETAKGAGILAVVLLYRREFDGVLDGMVCAGFIGVGFAFTENILYFGSAYLSGSSGELPLSGGSAALTTFVLRGVISPFAHPLFTTLTGIALGLAVTSRHRAAWLLVPLGLAGAIFMHALWNFSALGGFGSFLTSYTVFMFPAFAIAVGLALWLRRRESRLLAATLPAYVAAGWIPPYDVPMVASLPGRRAARRWAAQRLGPAGKRAMGNYQEAATELAFLRDRAQRLGADRSFPAREGTLLAALHRSRAALAPALHPQGVPPEMRRSW